jgi:CheY-like chemotaxis protein
VKNLYNRVENLDELIRSVKLPYLAWKILFLVNKNADSTEISGLLDTDEESVTNSLQLLTQNGLVFVEKDAEPVDKEVDVPIVEDVPVELPEETLDETSEDVLSEVNALDSEDTTEERHAPEAEEVTPLIEDEVEQNADDVLDELMNGVEEQDSDEVLEELLVEQEVIPDEVETLVDEPEVESEEEKIEINIPESDEVDDISDEMEFNFNLTGEEKSEEKVDAQPAVEEPVEDTTDKTKFKKILVIDDSLVIRKMVEIALEEEEFVIETAVSGKEGLEVMDQTNPNLVILDMMLPDINGIEILKTIKASKGIPVIMLSGKDSPQMIETAKNEGAEEFLPKPFKDDDLVDKIKKLI